MVSSGSDGVSYNGMNLQTQIERQRQMEADKETQKDSQTV